MLDPDDGSSPIEADPSDDAVISYTWMTHGVFETTLTAEDEEGNSHSIEVSVRIDMHAVWSETNTNSATMEFDATPDCEDGEPLADISHYKINSRKYNGQLFTGGSECNLVILINSTNLLATPDPWVMDNLRLLDYTTRDTMPGIWSIVVDVTQGDNVNVENDVTIAYPEGSEDSPNPRTE